jgi:hypothetical protein
VIVAGGLGQFGDSKRNFLRGPHLSNLDLALFKNFDLLLLCSARRIVPSFVGLQDEKSHTHRRTAEQTRDAIERHQGPVPQRNLGFPLTNR